MEIKNNRHYGGDFERHLSECRSDPGRIRYEGRELGVLIALQRAERKGFIDFSKIKRAFDFGSGYGGPTSALKHFLPEGATLEVAEICPFHAAQIVHFGIVPQDRVYKEGFRYLQDQKSVGVRLDLVTAFMFGPEDYDLTFEKLLSHTASVTSPEGQILLTSDEYTFRNLMVYCRDNRIEFKVSPGTLTTCTMSNIPSILLIKGKDI